MVVAGPRLNRASCHLAHLAPGSVVPPVGRTYMLPRSGGVGRCCRGVPWGAESTDTFGREPDVWVAGGATLASSCSMSSRVILSCFALPPAPIAVTGVSVMVCLPSDSVSGIALNLPDVRPGMGVGDPDPERRACQLPAGWLAVGEGGIGDAAGIAIATPLTLVASCAKDVDLLPLVLVRLPAGGAGPFPSCCARKPITLS
mmetsp:Transcript_32693/g.72219  ORF Transcript_32693/g.72219 Transcript_32693/m.72219 type:complete len:201 (-) Transcript_32693:1512-2114(-)